MERSSLRSIVLIFFIAVTFGVGFWQVSQAFAEKNACADDVSKFCKDVQPGQGRIIKCMKEHENELSAECKAQLTEMSAKRQEAREACEDDVARLCSNATSGKGGIMRCLKEHENELSPQCKAMMQQLPQKRTRQQ